jgi:hypothetical protein
MAAAADVVVAVEHAAGAAVVIEAAEAVAAVAWAAPVGRLRCRARVVDTAGAADAVGVCPALARAEVRAQVAVVAVGPAAVRCNVRRAIDLRSEVCRRRIVPAAVSVNARAAVRERDQEQAALARGRTLLVVELAADGRALVAAVDPVVVRPKDNSTTFSIWAVAAVVGRRWVVDRISPAELADKRRATPRTISCAIGRAVVNDRRRGPELSPARRAPARVISPAAEGRVGPEVVSLVQVVPVREAAESNGRAVPVAVVAVIALASPAVEIGRVAPGVVMTVADLEFPAVVAIGREDRATEIDQADPVMEIVRAVRAITMGIDPVDPATAIVPVAQEMEIDPADPVIGQGVPAIDLAVPVRVAAVSSGGLGIARIIARTAGPIGTSGKIGVTIAGRT